jgi:hypothetical protein
LYLPESPELIHVKEVGVRVLRLHYERRIEIVQAEVGAEDYGEMTVVYSLETALVWVPIEKHEHAVIACCDYPALRHILYYLRSRLDLNLHLPRLDTNTLQRIVHGAMPRKVTFSIIETDMESDEVQNITFADPLLEAKKPFQAAIQNSNREQTAGFYVNHPGLDLGGLGVARRDGKVWTPKRLDYNATAKLALTLIAQTEAELKKERDPGVLVNHYYGDRARIGEKEVIGKVHQTWQELVKIILATERNAKETTIQIGLVERLVQYQSQLGLVTAIEHDECPSCGTKWLAICPTCRNPLKVVLHDGLEASCSTCGSVVGVQLECECGQQLEYASLEPLVRILPEPELLQSITEAAKRFKRIFSGFFAIHGTILRIINRKQPAEPKRMHLADLRLWRDRARLHVRAVSSRRQEQLRAILNKTKEKCRRGGLRPSNERCSECMAAKPDLDWITRGDTCLARLFGIPINKAFDGVHHGHEGADIKYTDVVVDTGRQRQIGIHAKSRCHRPPPEGMGRTKYSIKGLYTQLAFSAFEARVRNEPVNVLGIGIPNLVRQEVLDSMQFMVNELGFSLLVIDESDWLKVLDAAMEQVELDTA